MAKVKIIELSKDTFIIEPIPTKPYSFENSIELEELKSQLTKLELNEGEDYSIEKSSSLRRFKFQGRSPVVRALWTIPEDMFDFSSSYPLSPQSFNRYKLNFATTLTKKECSVHDMQFRQKAFSGFYLYIKDEITKVHSQVSKPTTVMQQLDKDLLFIDKIVTEDPWPSPPKSHMALSSLVKAYKDEESNPTLVKDGFLSSLFKKESLLLPKYKEILITICNIQGTDFSGVCERHIIEYNLHVAAKQKEHAFITSTTSSSITPEKKGY